MSEILTGRKIQLAPLASLLLLPALLLSSGLAKADIYRSLDRNPPVFTNMLPTEGRWEIYIKDKSTAAPVQAAPEPRRYTDYSASSYASHIEAAATANNIDPALIRAVISAESGYNSNALSHKGAVGLMQLMPETASRYNVRNSRDPEQNIHGGARYLRDLLQMFNNDVRLAVAAYNAGEQAVIKYGNRIPPYRETIAYVPKVMKYYEQYRSGKPPPMQPSYQRFASVRRSNPHPKPTVMYLSNGPTQVVAAASPSLNYRQVVRR
ncbi:MAG: lytic transglycosylase catalytic [Betaproteobacteria bacterium]|nr:lytic transglycosylase catalytic [Betaproteobacteria bacterium]